MKLLPIRRGEITRAQIRFSVVPVIRGIMNASSGAGSRARTKTAACGAANRGFESHPARFPLSERETRDLGLSQDCPRTLWALGPNRGLKILRYGLSPQFCLRQ